MAKVSVTVYPTVAAKGIIEVPDGLSEREMESNIIKRLATGEITLDDFDDISFDFIEAEVNVDPIGG